MSATLDCALPTVSSRSRKPAATRQQTVNIRVRTGQISVIDQAAEMLGQSRSTFILERSVQAAEAVLLDQRLFVVDGATYDAFEAALDAPVKDNPKLAALLRKRAPWDR